MKRLPVPVRDVLDGSLDEAAAQRVWREVGRRRLLGAPAPSLKLSRLAWPIAAALALAAVAAGLTRSGWLGGPSPEPPPIAIAPLPLRLAGGGELSRLAPGAAAFDDGSRVELEADARLTLLENDGRVVTWLLEAGRARLAVAANGPRRWTVECGVFSAEVVGARFEVERVGGGARVRVDEGTVIVRGERVRDRVQRLVAGQSFELDSGEPVAPIESAAPRSPPIDSREGRQAALDSVAPGGSAAPAPTEPPEAWRELVRKGAYKEAYGLLGRDGIAQEAGRASLDELMLLADVARLSGHPTDAVAPLSRVVAEHRGDSRAGMAAFTLGRLRLDQLGQPAVAAVDFATAIALGLPAGLVEDAHARLVEARARAGDRAGAEAAAAEYERRFPDGRHAAAVRSWVAPR